MHCFAEGIFPPLFALASYSAIREHLHRDVFSIVWHTGFEMEQIVWSQVPYALLWHLRKQMVSATTLYIGNEYDIVGATYSTNNYASSNTFFQEQRFCYTGQSSECIVNSLLWEDFYLTFCPLKLSGIKRYN